VQHYSSVVNILCIAVIPNPSVDN